MPSIMPHLFVDSVARSQTKEKHAHTQNTRHGSAGMQRQVAFICMKKLWLILNYFLLSESSTNKPIVISKCSDLFKQCRRWNNLLLQNAYNTRTERERESQSGREAKTHSEKCSALVNLCNCHWLYCCCVLWQCICIFIWMKLCPPKITNI